MRSCTLFVAIRHDGETVVHAAGGINDYATLCGLANDGDQHSGVEVDLPPRPKIDCASCKRIFEIAKPLRPSDFFPLQLIEEINDGDE